VDEYQRGLVNLVGRQSEEAAANPALLGYGQPPLSYDGLRALVDFTHRKLLGAGLRRGDCVALVNSNGPEAAAAFLSIAAGHVCAPLNPAYRAVELELYLSHLKPKALVLDARLETDAAVVASRLGIPVFYLYPDRDRPAGTFSLETGLSIKKHANFAGGDEVALVLQTSGTTSRPKIVPLTHANLLDNARNICRAFQLQPSDRCLNIMPLFDGHGLVVAVLSSLAAGASVFCSPGFQVARFFSWFEDCGPTWYTAVPTAHQAILIHAARHRDVIARSRLRFMRSGASALPPRVRAELEDMFRVPVAEAYGMTEAATQIACNPLPPGLRKPGSAGISTGPEIAIMGPDGDLLPSGETGEIVIRGATVTPGYLNNPEANAGAFLRGWFRTGDRGCLDSDGYLFISGRTKEMINRGGEKIAPREIDEALMDHPAVQQAVAFAIPDARLGEDVGAAVVLREGTSATIAELQHFVGRRLAEFKVPRKIVFVSEIPKGPTGKVQRIGLAAKLQIVSAPLEKSTKPFIAPRNENEELLAAIWRQVLGLDQVSIHDGFFELGGDSSAAAQLLVCIRRDLGKDLAMASLLDAPTIASLAVLLRASVPVRPRVSVMQSGGSRTPFFCVHGHPLFRQLAQRASEGRAFLALVPPAVEDLRLPLTLENMAAYHVQSMRQVQPAGPYYLGGWCNDGVVALEIARQLRLSGEDVGGLVLFDSRNPRVSGLSACQGGRPSVWRRLRYHLVRMRQTPRRELPGYLALRGKTLAARLKQRAWQLGYTLKLLNDRRVSSAVRDMEQIVAYAVANYLPSRYDGPAILIRPQDRPRSLDEDQACGWKSVLADLEVHEVPGNHRTMFLSSNVEILASILCEMMDGEMSRVDHDAISAEPPETAHAGR